MTEDIEQKSAVRSRRSEAEDGRGGRVSDDSKTEDGCQRSAGDQRPDNRGRMTEIGVQKSEDN